LAWTGASAADAQLVLERQSDGVLLWSSATSSVQVPLTTAMRPRMAVEAEGGQIVAGTDDTTGELFFLHRADGSTRELPVPSSRTGALRTWPVLVTTNDRLDGALWLEGTSQQDFAIRAASWNGTSWERTELVAPSRGLPQLAVSATVLSDGSWLAVWAGYDGEDDEIYWSRRFDSDWSRPQRLHPGNRVPDILPSVIARGDRASVAWSFFDGNDYRVRTATWDGSAWQVEGTHEGLGAVDAGWQRVGERVFATYHSVEPEAWALIEVDDSGVVVHRSTVSGDVNDRPLVVAPRGARPRLVFPTRAGRDRR
jgi:hypothetical protein